MKPPRQPGLFDIKERAAQLIEMGDPLVGLKVRLPCAKSNYPE